MYLWGRPIDHRVVWPAERCAAATRNEDATGPVCGHGPSSGRCCGRAESGSGIERANSSGYATLWSRVYCQLYCPTPAGH